MSNILAAVQRLIGADKAVIVSTVTLAALTLFGSFGMHLSGQQVAVVTAIVSAGLGWFVHTHWVGKTGDHAK